MAKMTAFDQARLVSPHLFGERIDAVTHACPECPPSAPGVFCGFCAGTGLVDEPTLDRWARTYTARNGG